MHTMYKLRLRMCVCVRAVAVLSGRRYGVLGASEIKLTAAHTCRVKPANLCVPEYTRA